MKYHFIGIMLIQGFIAASAYAEPPKSDFVKVPELKCPEEISVAPDQKLNKTPKGWRKFVDKTYRSFLDRANFYSGAPEGMAMLMPDDNAIAEFDDKHDGWISCVYRNTVVQITRKVPKQFHACRAVHYSKEATDKNPLIGTLDFIECR